MRLRKHYIYLCATVLFWGNRSARITMEKSHKTGPNRCTTNSKEGTRRKMDTLPFIAWFVSLVLLMLSWKITNICWKPAADTAPVNESVGSPALTQFEWVNQCLSVRHTWWFVTWHEGRVWPSDKACCWWADRQRFKPISALFSFFHKCDLLTLYLDLAMHLPEF